MVRWGPKWNYTICVGASPVIGPLIYCRLGLSDTSIYTDQSWGAVNEITTPQIMDFVGVG